MQLIRENCETCVGPTREACDALFAGLRNKTGDFFEEGLDLADEDMIGFLALQETAHAAGEDLLRKLSQLDCKLTGQQVTTGLLSEVFTGIELRAGDLDEQDRLAREAHDQRMAELDRRMAELDAEAERLRSARQDRLEGLLVEAKDTLTTTSQQPTADAEEQVHARMAAAAQAYCDERGLDADNLNLADRMDQKAHLRKLGFEL